MHPLLNTLKNLSETASNVLPFLEKYDYRKEAKAEDDRYIPMDILPKPLQEIVESVLVYCTPLISRDDNLPQDELLNKRNMQIFIENLNVTGDSDLVHCCQFIELEPIMDVAHSLNELGLTKQGRLLANAYEFGAKLRSCSRTNAFRPYDGSQPPIQVNFTVPAEELSDDEKLQARRYADFCAIFKPGGLNSAQRKALFDAFGTTLAQDKKNKPHLVVVTAILLLMNQRVYGKPLTGTFNSIRTTVFTTFGWPANTANSYPKDALKKGITQSLYNYREKAAQLLSTALENTR